MDHYDASALTYGVTTLILFIIAIYNLYMLVRYFSWDNLVKCFKLGGFIILGLFFYTGTWWYLIGGVAVSETYLYFSTSMAFFSLAMFSHVKLVKTQKEQEEGGVN
jgi:hypothetical protein